MFRFTIRDVLWLTVVVAMGLGWWAERSNLRQRIESRGKWFALSIDGPGYFPIVDDKTNAAVYVRGGYVSLNKFGQLIVRAGDSQWLLEPSTQIPLSQPFSVHPDGRVFVQGTVAPNGDSVWSPVGRLSLAVFARPDRLRKVGPGIYRPTDESGPPIITMPGENDAGFVRHSF